VGLSFVSMLLTSTLSLLLFLFYILFLPPTPNFFINDLKPTHCAANSYPQILSEPDVDGMVVCQKRPEHFDFLCCCRMPKGCQFLAGG
jgi:hypothetical protein